MNDKESRFGEMDAAVALNKELAEKGLAAAEKPSEENYPLEQGSKNLGEAIAAEAKYQLVLEAIRDGRIDQETAKKLTATLKYLEGLSTADSGTTTDHNETAGRGVQELNKIVAKFELVELTDDEVLALIEYCYYYPLESKAWNSAYEMQQLFRSIAGYVRQDLHINEKQTARVMSLLEDKWKPVA